MTYLLDTMIVSYFLQAQREADLGRASTLCPMAVVEEVRRELEDDKTRGGKAFAKWLGTTGISVLPIMLNTPAHTTLAALVIPANTGKNLGERASIALAVSDSSLTFVTNDKGASFLALRELWASGERILGLAVFLRRLFEERALDDPCALDDVMKVAATKLPTWWPAWRASITAPTVASEIAASPPGPTA